MSFNIAFAKMQGNEGGYANNKADLGGETYAGISRKYHPNWSGWAIVDQVKKQNKTASAINKALAQSANMKLAIKEFYFEQYWKAPGFDKVDSVNELIAEKLFDIGVHLNPQRPCKWLQEAINILNRNQQKYPNITVDGKIGNKTIEALKKCLGCNPVERILTVIKVYQGSHYVSRMQEKPDQQVFVGWIDRIGL